jgi:hypothetical protein
MLELQPLPDTVSICRLDPGAPLPDELSCPSLFADESSVIFGAYSRPFAPHTASFGANGVSGDGGN